jgi:hypothetical protein
MSDVSRWLFKQTIRNLAISLPSCDEQDMSHRRRKLAADKLGHPQSRSRSNFITRIRCHQSVREWEEQEARSIETLYSPSSGSQLLGLMNPTGAVLAKETSYQGIINVGRNFSLHEHDISSSCPNPELN